MQFLLSREQSCSLQVLPKLGFFFPLVTGTFTITLTLNYTTSCTLGVEKARQFVGRGPPEWDFCNGSRVKESLRNTVVNTQIWGSKSTMKITRDGKEELFVMVALLLRYVTAITDAYRQQDNFNVLF